MLQLVHRWLTNDKNGPWLLILDNADDKDVLSQPIHVAGSKQPLVSFVPKTGRGFILVTSRNDRAAEMLVGDDALRRVPAMDEGQAKHLLCAKVGPDLYDDDAATSLVDALNRMPLAIVQAASFIKRRSRRGETISTYLGKFHHSIEEKRGLLATEAPDLRRDESASKAVLTTLQVTFDQVRRESNSAITLLCWMSFLHPQSIPDCLLQPLYDAIKEADREDDIELLIGYGLVSATVDDHTLEMHALVQFCSQMWLSTFTDPEELRCVYITTMMIQYPTNPSRRETWPMCRKLHPHLQRAIEKRPKEDEDIRHWIKLLDKVIIFYEFSKEGRDEEELLRRMVDASTDLLGKEHPDTLWAMSRLALKLMTEDNLQEAETISRQILDTRTQMHGENHLDVLSCMHHVAIILQKQGKFGEAEKMMRKIVNGRRKVLGEEHRTSLSAMQSLATVLMMQGLDEAEPLERQVLEVSKRVLGEEDPNTMASLYNLSLIMKARGEYEEAEQMQRQVLEVRARTMGEDHPSTLSLMYLVAGTCWNHNNKQEALHLLRTCISHQERKLGFDHQETQLSRSTLDDWERAI